MLLAQQREASFERRRQRMRRRHAPLVAKLHEVGLHDSAELIDRVTKVGDTFRAVGQNSSDLAERIARVGGHPFPRSEADRSA